MLVNTRKADRFYFVWTKTGTHNPKKTYHNLASAQSAARAMARRFPDKRWFIVEAVERFWVNGAEDRLPRPATPHTESPA